MIDFLSGTGFFFVRVFAQAVNPDPSPPRSTLQALGFRTRMSLLEIYVAPITDHRAQRATALEIEALEALGLTHEQLGETQPAIECYEQVLAATAALGETVYRSRALWAIAIAVWTEGDSECAVRLLTEALHLAREVPDRLTTGTSIVPMAWIAGESGDSTRAAMLMAAVRGHEKVDLAIDSRRGKAGPFRRLHNSAPVPHDANPSDSM